MVIESGQSQPYPDERETREWPVRWDLLSDAHEANDLSQSSNFARPDFAAHRQLDWLGALAAAAARGSRDAETQFSTSLHTLVQDVPQLGEHHPALPETGDDAGPGCDCGSTDGRADPTTISVAGVIPIVAAAFRMAGKEGADAVRALYFAALEAEAVLPAFQHLSERNPQDENPQGVVESKLPAAPEVEQLKKLLSRLKTVTASASPSPAQCFLFLDQFMLDIGQTEPQPPARLTWIDGVTRVEVSEPCSDTPKLIIHGTGFSSSQPTNVGIVAPFLDFETKTTVYRQIPVLSWSATRIDVEPGGGALSGSLAFVDKQFLSDYDTWAKFANRTINTQMKGEGCPGYNPARPTIVWPPFPVNPVPSPVTAYQLGSPKIYLEVHRDPIGTLAPYWETNSIHTSAGEAFWVIWNMPNATSGALKASNPEAVEVLTASGFPQAEISGVTGKVRLVSPNRHRLLKFSLTANNAACGATTKPLHVVVTGRALRPLEIKVMQGLAGGDVDVTSSGGVETLSGGAPNSIPLVAEKRSVVQVDWWPAIPQVPLGAQPAFAVAQLDVRNHGAWPSLSGTLRPGQSTAEDPPSSSVTLYTSQPFDSIAAYETWLQSNVPQTFNVVIPGEWCKWESTFTATVKVFSPGQPTWTVTTSKRVNFHRRRRVRIRYRRHTVPGRQPPTTEQAVQAIRNAASILPIPDPEILVLGNDPAAPSSGYIEDMFAERGGTPTLQWRDEIWLVVGPVGVGGVASISRWPWIAATDATGLTTAHEIGHLFSQAHLNLCGLTDGDNPAQFPNSGVVPVTGWDMWNNAVVRNARDIMVRTYCPEPTWMSPERWRRIFLQVGPG